MIGVPRVMFLMFAITMLGVVAVAGLPRVMPGLNRVDESRWRGFRAAGGAFVPPRGFNVHDPFSPTTRYHGVVWFHDVPPENTAMALLQAPHGRLEYFLIDGPRDRLETLLEDVIERHVQHPYVQLDEARTARTADGVQLTIREVRFERGVRDEDVERHVIAYGAHGDHLLIVNGGGTADVYDPAATDALLATIRAPR